MEQPILELIKKFQQDITCLAGKDAVHRIILSQHAHRMIVDEIYPPNDEIQVVTTAINKFKINGMGVGFISPTDQFNEQEKGK